MEPGNTEHYLEQLNLTELMEQLNRCFSSAFLADFSLEQLFSDILSGNGKEALQLLGRQIAGSVGQEFSGMRQILSVLLLLGILSVLVSCLMGSFENQQVAQIAHDMFFLLVLTVLLKVFSAVYRITGSTLETLKQFSHLTLPALCLSLGPAAGSVTAAGYYELTLGFIFLIERFKDPKQMQMHHTVKYIFFLLFHKITPFSPAPFSRHTPDDAFPGYRFWRDILPKSP